jgi:mRNA interferase MazF
MPSYSRGSVILVRYPFSDLSGSKVRPAVVVGGDHESRDIFIVPLTSRTADLKSGEFVLSDSRGAGLHVPTAVKRGLYTIEDRLILKTLGALASSDRADVDRALIDWLELTPTH